MVGVLWVQWRRLKGGRRPILWDLRDWFDLLARHRQSVSCYRNLGGATQLHPSSPILYKTQDLNGMMGLFSHASTSVRGHPPVDEETSSAAVYRPAVFGEDQGRLQKISSKHLLVVHGASAMYPSSMSHALAE